MSAISSDFAGISARKLRANRRNARKSTGPRSAEGKMRSSRNACRHGIFSARVVLDGESMELFTLLREGFIRRLRPQDILELSLVEQIVTAHWRLRRCQEAEGICIDSMGSRSKQCAAREVEKGMDELGIGELATPDLDESDDADPSNESDQGDDSDNPVEQQESDADSESDTKDWIPENDEQRHRAKELQLLNQADEVTLPASANLASIMLQRKPAVETLSRYEQRLHNMSNKLLRELERLREGQKLTDLPPGPFVEELESADDASVNEVSTDSSDQVSMHTPIVQNEPTESQPTASPAPTDGCDESDDEFDDELDEEPEDDDPNPALTRAVAVAVHSMLLDQSEDDD